MYYLDEEGKVEWTDSSEPLMIPTAGDLSKVPPMQENTIYMPGLVVYTPGWEHIWQMKADGTYKQIV